MDNLERYYKETFEHLEGMPKFENLSDYQKGKFKDTVKYQLFNAGEEIKSLLNPLLEWLEKLLK